MTLRPCTDVATADWLLDPSISVWRMVELGPPGFEAYARLRYIPDPTRADMDEADAVIDDDHLDEADQIQQSVSILTRFTGTPDDLVIGLWDGSGLDDLPDVVVNAPMIRVPTAPMALREYALMTGTACDIPAANLPAFVWPADHSWCIASDVDPHWAGIGGSAQAIDALLAAVDIDVVPTDPARAQPHYY